MNSINREEDSSMVAKPRVYSLIFSLLLTMLWSCNLVSHSSDIPGIELETSTFSEDATIQNSPTTTVSPSAPGLDETAIPAENLDASRAASSSINAFFESSWRSLMLRDPEWVLAEGLSEEYGLQGAELTDISDEYQQETMRLVQSILDELHSYGRDTLTPEEKISYDVYEWYLQDQLNRADFMYHDYLATFYPVTSVHDGTLYFFSDLHPITDMQEAEDYITRLQKVELKFSQLIDGLELREHVGVIPPRFSLQWALPGVNNMAKAPADQTPFYQAFERKLSGLKDIDQKKKTELLQRAEKAIQESVLPAYQELAHYLEHQVSISPLDDGLWQFESGIDYYDYLLHHFTTTEMSSEEIHQLGLRELERIHAEMDAIFENLDYPKDASLGALFNRVAQDSGFVSGPKLLETYQAILAEADQNLGAAFDLRPQAELVVIHSPIKGMYVSPSLDGTRPGAFHAGPSDAREQVYAMPTLAFHEGIPGHHFQIALAMEADLPTFRNLMRFTGYAEGWALYAEQLAAELGWYEDDPYGNLGRLQAEAFRAARLVVDTGIHTKGWTFEEARKFFTENTGFEIGDSVNPDHEIARYIVWPGQATAYKVGMLKFLELRQRAMERLGEQFDLKEFHNIMLRNGSMPLEVLERLIDDYIDNKLSS